MNHSNPPDYSGFRNLLEKNIPVDANKERKEYIKSTLRQFCINFFGELYQNKELMNKLWISGGTIGNIWHFYTKNKFFCDDLYREAYPNTDIDIYINLMGECDHNNNIFSGIDYYVDPILKKYENRIKKRDSITQTGTVLISGGPNTAPSWKNIEVQTNKSPYTDNCWTIDTHDLSYYIFTNTVQIIKNLELIGPPSTVAPTFDFEHCKAYYLIGSGELVINRDQEKLLIKKELVHYASKSENPEKRLKKYTDRGWKLIHTHYDKSDFNDPIPF